ncbi:hypothetical protein [Sutcliffiella rhizosphaerae]|uniref:Uncharacterized protein n=1 Tax=Sutcliffiella rhizosphaerae TaxID=2880967 RepID=A0ABM8YPW2_9BACI|nr:hypothetical protein [Sutcliffiella rhizosphaerae]CAG9622040.1 hypothetical protein BACCIP111883_02831 [Sutcliffiella rhizosphaerae]
MKKHEKNNNNVDEEFLSPLQKRPGLEPGSNRLEETKRKIFLESNRKQKSFSTIKVIVPTVLTILLFSFLCYSFINDYRNMTEAPNQENSLPAIQESDDQRGVVTQQESDSVEEFISKTKIEATELLKQEDFKRIHEELQGMFEYSYSTDVFIVYLNALKTGNLEKAKKFAFLSNSSLADKKLEALSMIYKSINFSTVSVSNVTLSRGEPSAEIILSYEVLTYDDKNNNRIRSIILNYNDDAEFVTIYEPEI